MSRMFKLKKLDDRGLNYSSLNPDTKYRIKELGVDYNREFPIKGISLNRVFNSYEENHNGYFIIRHLCNFESVKNSAAILVIDNNVKQDKHLLACDIKFTEFSCFIGIDKKGEARLYFEDNSVIKVTNIKEKHIMLEITNDFWDLSLIKIIPIKRKLNLNILKLYLSKKGEVTIYDKR